MHRLDYYIASALTHLKNAEKDLLRYQEDLRQLQNPDAKKAFDDIEGHEAAEDLKICISKVESFLERMYSSNAIEFIR